MKELILGILAFIGATIVSVVMIPLGTVYSIGYPWFMVFKGHKPWHYILRHYMKMVDGIFASIGHIIYYVAEGLDYLWNVIGEILEDIITHRNETHFGEKNITVSATTGEIETAGDLNKFGRFLSKLLNFAFMQRNHCTAAWKYTVARRKLKEELFEKK